MQQRVEAVRLAQSKTRRTQDERDLIEAFKKGCIHPEFTAFLCAPFGNVVRILNISILMPEVY
jgi:hypothetical protein